MEYLLMNQFYNANMNACISIFTPCNSTLYDGYQDFINEDRFLELYCSNANFIIDSFAINGDTIQITVTKYIKDGVVYYL